jgi:hypothetical protein
MVKRPNFSCSAAKGRRCEAWLFRLASNLFRCSLASWNFVLS